MKKVKSLFSILLAVCFVFTCIPFVMAEADTSSMEYYQSFLLWVNSKTLKEYTKEDFPLVQNLSCIYTVKTVPVETGYNILLLMGLTTTDADSWFIAKAEADEYGKTYENALARDYEQVKSYLNLNYQAITLKVGESFDLKIADYNLERTGGALFGVEFTIDPTVIDPTALVNGGYEQWGLADIYGQYVVESQWYGNSAALVYWYGESKGKVSENHSYVARIENTENAYEVINNLIKQPGIVQAQLAFERVGYIEVAPSLSCTVEDENLLSVQTHYENGPPRATVTALQPGKTVVNVQYGWQFQFVTATCVVTVVEPTYSYGDVNLDEQINAKDALLVLRYSVGKYEFTPKQLEMADFSYQLYQTENHKGVNAKDALVILQFVCHTGPFRHDFLTTVSYTDYDEQTRYDYSWEVSSLKSYPDVLCRSLEELKAYLVGNELPEEWADAYTKEYFETKSLLLFTGFEPCAGNLWTVEEIQKSKTGLNVKVVHHSLSTIEVAAMHLYHLEIHDPLKEIEWGYIRRTNDYGTRVANILVNS